MIGMGQINNKRFALTDIRLILTMFFELNFKNDLELTLNLILSICVRTSLQGPI